MSGTPPPLANDAALFLDFDGTLTHIQENPATVFLPDGGADVLLRVAKQLNGALVIISGRDIRDLATRTPSTLWRIGGHGLDVCAPGEDPAAVAHEPPETLTAALQSIVASFKSVRLEQKGAVFAIHYRAAPEIGDALHEELQQSVAAYPEYRLEHGKMVFELKPPGASKGEALTSMMRATPFAGRTPLIVGDDTTDEAAMIAAIKMGGAAIKVGDGESAARLRFDNPDAVWEWLKEAANR